MTYALYLGDRSYSSWSLRAWLLGEAFDLLLEHRWVQFSRDATVAEQMPEMAPARTVPALKLPEGGIVADSLAIAEELASRFPEAGLWPEDPQLRAMARDLAAEMHSSFRALRSECPMNLRVAYEDFAVSEAVADDLARICEIWEHALAVSGGPWLAGRYSVADAFYAPVAARIAT
ncbi:MAG: glutathione S-transferase N-terminal domain-containing protein, partial [Pseudomonadota bacterium]